MVDAAGRAGEGRKEVAEVKATPLQRYKPWRLGWI